MANQYRSVLASSGPAPTGGDALPAEVLSGKTFTNDNGAQTGTMPNRGAVSQTLTAGASYTIPEGYHNGSGVVTDASPVITPIAYRFYEKIDSTLAASVNNRLEIPHGGNFYQFVIRGAKTVNTTGGSASAIGIKADGTYDTLSISTTAINTESYIEIFGSMGQSSGTTQYIEFTV